MSGAAPFTGPAGAAPVPVRDAATVVLLRDGADGLEAWMLVRVAQMVFAGGMAVFPGGRVDAGDAALPFADPDPGPDVAARFGTDVELGRALAGAAVRETWEETGVLLAAGDAAAVSAQLSHRREEVEAGRTGFGDLLREQGVLLDASGVRPWSRWITPEGEVRRYDTRFFVATLPAGAVAEDVTTESSEAGWVGVADAIDQAQRGERGLLPPTLITLAQLGRHPDVAAVLAAADERPIEPISPTIRQTADGGLLAELPDGSAIPIPRSLFPS